MDSNNDAPLPLAMPETLECAICGQSEGLYTVGGAYLCLDHIAEAVAMAATDIWPDAVSYSREFEDVLLW